MMKPDDQTLESLYLDEKLSYAEIARRHGVTKQSVARWLQAAGISARSTSEATSLATKGKPVTDKQRAARKVSAAKARAARTPESSAKWRAKMDLWTEENGHPRLGTKWTPEQRERHTAYRSTPEYRKKLSDAQKGERAHNWQGGQTTAEQRRMQGREWRERRRECYERDNWTCRDCGVKCHNEVRIAAHHIVPRRHGGGDEIENLATLCASCHRSREHRYAGAFIA